MLVLAIDTSTKVGTVALYSEEKGVLGEIFINSTINHSETIMGSVDSLFKITGINIKDVNKVAVSTGPGSFTGIRIGVGLAKGLAYSLKAPIVGVNELDVIANLSGTLLDEKCNIISLIDARKERVYYCVYRQEKGEIKKVSEYLAGDLEEVLEKYSDGKNLFLGDGSIVYREKILEKIKENAVFYNKSLCLPRASILAELALKKESDNLISLEPFYISKTQAEREKNKKEKNYE
ncbi:MAG: tRNA (adenosine(37)-N6)-threonylcarbamoyltransferase complex dimerization subunit type 1 TsaB [Fusobacteriaceae bacterium]